MKYNVMHKYHKHPADVDNDLFMVLGHVNHDLINTETLTSAHTSIRNLLARQQPVTTTLGIDNLTVVGYSDTRLPPASCLQYTIHKALKNPEYIRSFYRKIY